MQADIPGMRISKFGQTIIIRKNVIVQNLQKRRWIIHNNPVRSGIVWKAEDYIYSSAINYTGRKGILDIDLI